MLKTTLVCFPHSNQNELNSFIGVKASSFLDVFPPGNILPRQASKRKRLRLNPLNRSKSQYLLLGRIHTPKDFLSDLVKTLHV